MPQNKLNRFLPVGLVMLAAGLLFGTSGTDIFPISAPGF